MEKQLEPIQVDEGVIAASPRQPGFSDGRFESFDTERAARIIAAMKEAPEVPPGVEVTISDLTVFDPEAGKTAVFDQE